jgi:hypothetical protein
MNIYEVLGKIQKGLQVPKENYNKFSDFKYRKCEDILECVKKVLPDECYVVLSDDVVTVGERYYVKATASFHYKDQCVTSQSFAREPLEKKKFDDSQITGAASSYARKYALSGLFMIDDNRDVDAQEIADEKVKPVNNVIGAQKYFKSPISEGMSRSTSEHLRFLFSYLRVTDEKKEKIREWAKVANLKDLSEQQALFVIKNLEKEDEKAVQAWMEAELAKVREGGA